MLFRAFKKMLPADEYAELGERFEQQGHELLGEGGFGKAVDQVARTERQLGIHDLDRLTPTV